MQTLHWNIKFQMISQLCKYQNLAVNFAEIALDIFIAIGKRNCGNFTRIIRALKVPYYFPWKHSHVHGRKKASILHRTYCLKILFRQV